MVTTEKRRFANAQESTCYFGPAPIGRKKARLAHVRVDRYDSPFTHPQIRRAVRLVQEYADRKRSAVELAEAARRLDALADAARPESVWTIFETLRTAVVADEARTARAVADVLRWLLGDPADERPPVRDPEWLTADVTGLVRVIDRDRAFELLPILADALEEAGCADARILDHCRSGGPHAPGCWVVDLLFGRE